MNDITKYTIDDCLHNIIEQYNGWISDTKYKYIREDFIDWLFTKYMRESVTFNSILNREEK